MSVAPDDISDVIRGPDITDSFNLNKKKLDKIKFDKIKKYVFEPNPHLAEYFHRATFFCKIAVLGSLVGLSFKYADTSYITEHPWMFVIESLMVGTVSSMGTYMLARNRGVKNDKRMFYLCIMVLIFFITFNVMMELSGMNNPEGRIWGDGKEILNKMLAISVVKISMIIVVITPLVLNLIIKDNSICENDCTIFKLCKKSIVESLMFGIINASPTFLLAKNRGADWNEVKNEFGFQTSVFTFGYFVLQFGGFFTHAFRDKENKNRVSSMN